MRLLAMLLLLVPSLLLGQQSEPGSYFLDGRREKAEIFCLWSKDKAWALDASVQSLCQSYSTGTADEITSGFERVFSSWYQSGGDITREREFEVEFARAKEERLRKLAAEANSVKRAAAQKAESARRVDFLAQISTALESDLCAEARRKDGLPQAFNELVRRKSFPDSDILTIRDKKIRIGMREKSLLCSWGAPKSINRTVTISGERKQFVYSGGVYVYVENGIITAFQD